jgi:periplasmic protein TonB
MAPSKHRLPFLISVTVHLVLMTSLISLRARKPAPWPAELPAEVVEPAPQRVFLPPPPVLRRLLPAPAPPPPTPPPPRRAQDRISVGAPSTERQKGPLVMKRDEDLFTPKGRPDAAPTPVPTPSAVGEGKELPPTQGPLPLPTGPGRERAGSGDGQARPGETPAPSVASSLRELEKRLAAQGPVGTESGVAGRQMGPLFFDPAGADFTAWLNHFKNEVYRNWIVPQAALFGFRRGHVDITFTVGRDGTIRRLEVQKSSGTPALDRAAVNALRGGRLLPLPTDYGPPEVTMEVTFFYGEGPRG